MSSPLRNPQAPPAQPSGGVATGTAAPYPVAPALLPLMADTGAPSSPPPATRRSTKPPKDSKTYKVAAAYFGLRAQGMKLAEISETLGIPKQTIQTYVKRSISAGWFTYKESMDVEDQIEYSIPDKVVRNVNEFLDARDKDMTVEAAKGLGIFKQHQAVKVDGAVNVGMALSVRVEMPPLKDGQSPIAILPGSVGGTPALEGEVVEE